MPQVKLLPAPAVDGPSDPKRNPPTYLMKPWPHMPDYFRVPDLPHSNSYGVAYNVPLQEGEWALEPMYKNASVSFLFNCHSRHAVGENLLEIDLPPGVIFGLHKTCCTKMEDADVWLHCQALTGIDPKVPTSSATVVVDIVDFEKTYTQRRSLLKSKFIELGLKQIPDDKYAFLAPSIGENHRYHMWYALHEVNRKIQDLYSGMVAKRCDSMYERNVLDPKLTTLWWMEHRFILQ